MKHTFNFKHVPIWFILILLWISLSYGQQYASIYLKNGDRFKGRWLGADETSVQIEVYNQKLSIPFHEIINITPFDDLRSFPNEIAETHFIQGQGFLELEMREKAKARFMAAIEEFPKYADAHYQLGLLFQAEGNNDEALRYFGYVVKINPEAYNMADQFKEAGDAYLAAEEYRKAVNAYMLLFQNYPNRSGAESAAYTAGFLLAEQLGEAEEGLKILKNAVAQFPRSQHLERALYLIGGLQSKLGAPEKAVETLTGFIGDHPQSQWLAEAYLARGEAYSRLRQKRKAIADFNSVNASTSNLKLEEEARKKRNEIAWTIYTVSDGILSNQIQAIAVDGETLWIGTPKGLAQINLGPGTWQPVTDVTGYINPLFDEAKPINVRALAVDGQDLWIGTLNHGVIRYNKLTRSYETYDKRKVLPHNMIYDIKIDKDEVWIGTFSGVVRYVRSTGEWMHYNKSKDGLPADDIVALAVTPEMVWVGTSESVMAVYNRKLDHWQDFDLDLEAGSEIVNFAVSRERVFFTWNYDGDKSNGYGEILLNDLSSQVQGISSGDLVPYRNIHIAITESPRETEEVEGQAGDVSGAGSSQPESATPKKMEELATLWIATNAGVWIRRLGSWREEAVKFPSSQLSTPIVNCITLGKDTAWIGTADGLARIDTGAIYGQVQ